MQRPMPTVLTRILAALLCFGALEGLVFHSSLYSWMVEPDSTTGGLETQLRNEMRRPKPDPNQVLAVGHSRMSLLPRVANEMKPTTGYTFASVGLGGTTPRCWYYELRYLDPDATRYAAILIPSDDYDEPDGEADFYDDRELDLHYLIARLRIADAFDLPGSYAEPELKWEAFRDIFLKGLIYKRDFMDFLAHPSERLAKVRLYQEGSAGWFYDFRGTEDSLAGIQVDWKTKSIRYPARAGGEERKRIHDELFAPASYAGGRQSAYFRTWYGRIVAHYRGSRTKIIFLRVPRAPISPPDHPPKPTSSIRQLASRPGVIVLDEHLLDSLERPEFFWDGWHLNGEGMARFSRTLAEEVRRVLGPPQT